MTRSFWLFWIALALLVGSIAATASAERTRAEQLRGYADPTRDADLPFRVPRLGVNADLSRYDDLPAQFDLMRAAGITWVRHYFYWDAIQPDVETFAWDEADRIVNAIAQAPDLRVVAVLMRAPAWARTASPASTATAPPDDPAAFAAFAGAFAARYGATVDHYQLWDEPNLWEAWGESEPRAAEYAALLDAGYRAIHAADARATVIAAALAPTIEDSARNVHDWRYLEDLYRIGARDSFDAMAAKPYGFESTPDERSIDPGVLNVSRIIRLREIMQANGDGRKALWASEWGWNALPADWPGAPSIWGAVDAGTRAAYTLALLDRAEREWAWMGGMILRDWQPPAATPNDDPRWGFALIDANGTPAPTYNALSARLRSANTAIIARDGLYAPANPYTRYQGVWTFGDLGADIGWVQDSRFAFDFEGREVALLLREHDALAFLYPTIDGAPANALPRDPNGAAFLSLRSDTLQPTTALVTVARDLFYAPHTLAVTADRGWDRWALAGIAVSSGDLEAPHRALINVGLLAIAVTGIGTLAAAWRVKWRAIVPFAARPIAAVWRAIGDAGRVAAAIGASLALMIGMLLTWGDAIPNILRREPVAPALAVITGGVLFIQPHLFLTVAAAIVVFVIAYHRVDLGLMLIVLYAPFYLFPVDLWRFSFPMAELLILITFAAYCLRRAADWARLPEGTANPLAIIAATRATPSSSIRFGGCRFSLIDGGVIGYLLLGALALVWSDQRARAITEYRTLFIEPALFYLILRTASLDRRAVVRLIDTVIAAGVLVAVIGLVQYARGEAIITAEAGARRLASVYGSPNNVGLLFGRVIPFAVAIAIARVDGRRRIGAIVALVIITPALLLSQSAGALFIGVPAACAAVLAVMWGRRGWIALGGVGTLAVVGALIAQRVPRFARLLSAEEGTTFYRLRAWASAWEAIRQRPLTGLGLDQFLYWFQGRVMMPDAWQEPYLSHPHNLMLDFWTRLGVLGIALLIAWQIAFWRAAVRAWHALRSVDPLGAALVAGAIGAMVNTLAHGLIDNSIFVIDLAILFILVLALPALALKTRQVDSEAAGASVL